MTHIAIGDLFQTNYDQSSEVANEAIELANDAIERALEVAGDVRSTTLGPRNFSLTGIPRPDRDTSDPNETIGDFNAALSTAWGELYPLIDDEWNQFINTWFPNWGSLKANLVNWLNDVIVNGTIGIPVSYENAVWQRERDRVVEEVNRHGMEIADAIGNRGFSLPTGVMLAQTEKVSKAGLDENSKAARDQAIQHVEEAIKNVQFAIDKAVELQKIVMSAVLGYVDLYLKAYGTAVDYSANATRYKDNLWSRFYEYYKVYYQWGELMLRLQQSEADINVRIDGLNFDKDFKIVEQTTRAAIEAAEQFKARAVQALARNNANISVSSQEQETVDPFKA